MSSFWNEVKKQRRTKVKSTLTPDDFNKFYSSIMTDIGGRNDEQLHDQTLVESYNSHCMKQVFNHNISSEWISDIINSLHHGKSDIDGVTAEHLIHGKSQTLCYLLSDELLTISKCCVPTIFHTGLKVPILKKTTLNPNVSKNYRL